MKAKKRRKLVIILIANDLINSRLIYGLDALNIVAGAYALYLTVPILKLMGFKGEHRTEEVIDLYETLVKSYSIGQSGEPNYNNMSALAEEIFQEIVDKYASSSIETNDDIDNSDLA